MSIDDMLSAAAKRGELSHLSIIGSAQKGGVMFRASYRGATGDTKHAEDADPAAAVVKALKGKG